MVGWELARKPVAVMLACVANACELAGLTAEGARTASRQPPQADGFCARIGAMRA
jgi:hypothetical protein